MHNARRVDEGTYVKMIHGRDAGRGTFRAIYARALKVALTVALPLVPLSAVNGQAEDPVLARQLIMQQLEEEADALGSIAAGITPPAKMAEHARAVAKLARESYDAFKPNAPGGAAKPEIWTNWADYSKHMEDFVSNADKLVKAADPGNLSDVNATLVDALPCQQCHDVYRQKKS
ncbi:MAG: cytochrome c [Novosphingobium sp.]|nr:cytochrome c [Novosphingobium sp.]